MITLPYSKIENAITVDESRPVLSDVWFDAGKGRLVAADGFILAVVPVETEDSDMGGHIPLEAVKEARRNKGRAYLEAGEDYVTVPFNDDNRWTRPPWPFPDYDQIVPVPDEEHVRITLDARRLMQLAEALCEEEHRAKRKGAVNHDAWGITLTFKPDGVSPVLVHPLHEPNKPRGRYGVIMPMHRSGK